MPKLTGEELSKLYPQAKTYDELREARERTKEARRPKHATTSVALWTALVVPVVLGAYQAILRFAPSLTSGSTIEVLSGVCSMILLAIASLAIVYYLYSLVDATMSKIFLTTEPLYLTLLLLLCAMGGLGALLQSHGFNPVITATALFLLTFMCSALAVKVFEKHEV